MTTYLSAGVMSVDWVHECLERSKPVVNRSYSQKQWLREFHIKATYQIVR
ncbi:hypothetical protein HBI56_155380 [Parastagonospora nodorum]|uniref:BRCT domain-containing protein n=1 Tax=Phaeosphaeria nodorum (strain SN15 / ATCC MYA-4574 / FGSC 10173) TaxID=321614 RepID=A0A7U2I8M6_PHANO|nr:hypothetical protein HBH56_118080 [Parastagonospora nodorum]QRD05255.1 hypothetical protein JI435_422180 [Parastagonospora nodorum SN15]KAH3928905.1 hypothetical protein HBH54_131130 [Parastagonospora nodorum]KAH3950635.1 hypothetical protein HBH53_071400 [Parastagonospora nodorum]KAH3959812.1 hypothetical protein HBH51_196490 [Parastagonospora nodorum]